MDEKKYGRIIKPNKRCFGWVGGNFYIFWHSSMISVSTIGFQGIIHEIVGILNV